MTARLNHFETAPDLAKALVNASMAAQQSSLGPVLKHLIEIRASQLNHCTFCLDMHVKQAKISGERELRLYHLAVWRDSPLFDAREKAALALTEALTQLTPSGVSDELYQACLAHFSEKEISELTYVIAIINSWNRMQVLAQTPAGAMDVAYGLDWADLR